MSVGVLGNGMDESAARRCQREKMISASGDGDNSIATINGGVSAAEDEEDHSLFAPCKLLSQLDLEMLDPCFSTPKPARTPPRRARGCQGARTGFLLGCLRGYDVHPSGSRECKDARFSDLYSCDILCIAKI